MQFEHRSPLELEPQTPKSLIFRSPDPDLAGKWGGNPRFRIRPESGNGGGNRPGIRVRVSRFGRERESAGSRGRWAGDLVV